MDLGLYITSVNTWRAIVVFIYSFILEWLNQLEITYKITPTMPMHKLKSHFASQLGIPYENICFMFYEKVVNQNDTAESLHLTNNCTLMAFGIALEKPKVYRMVENGVFV
ncbi:unnamed protein product [Caenorhabditis brenneri]